MMISNWNLQIIEVNVCKFIGEKMQLSAMLRLKLRSSYGAATGNV
jgi:hypothetical protein